MPNVMAALPNIGGPSAQRRKVWLTPTTRVPCSNAANIGQRKTDAVSSAPGKFPLVYQPRRRLNTVQSLVGFC